MHRHFTRLRFEHEALEAENVADIIVLFIGHIILFADILAGNVNLNVAALIRDMRKGRLAHNTAGHHSACHGNRLAFVCFEIVFYRFRIGVHGVFYLLVGVFALTDEL